MTGGLQIRENNNLEVYSMPLKDARIKNLRCRDQCQYPSNPVTRPTKTDKKLKWTAKTFIHLLYANVLLF